MKFSNPGVERRLARKVRTFVVVRKGRSKFRLRKGDRPWWDIGLKVPKRLGSFVFLDMTISAASAKRRRREIVDGIVAGILEANRPPRRFRCRRHGGRP